MPKRRLLWHLFPSYGLLVAAAALLLGWAALRVLESTMLAATRNDLLSRADFLDARLEPDIPDDTLRVCSTCSRRRSIERGTCHFAAGRRSSGFR